MPRQASVRPLAKMSAAAPVASESPEVTAEISPAEWQALLQALDACDPLDGRALRAFLALDARQRRIVRSLIAELARSARRRGRAGG